ncbi:hypothetical protein Vi05172_g9448 [Venturia inaequalis]|nr:hypothetical protein Vi05172_g9448 [Venturia inaequalis]
MAPSVADIEVAPVPVVIRSLPERAIPVEAVAVENNSSVKPPSPIDEVAAIETPRACFDRASSHSYPPSDWRKGTFCEQRLIVGLRKEESDALLAFLVAHIGRGIDYQARIRWAPRTVVVWDNRVTSHSAIVDWTSGERRHLARITPQAEIPYETPYIGEV